MDVIPIQQVFDDQSRLQLSREARATIAASDVVIGYDERTQREYTVYGTPALEETVRVGQEVALRTARIAVDAKAGQLERLTALVQSVKRGQDQVGNDTMVIPRRPK